MEHPGDGEQRIHVDNHGHRIGQRRIAGVQPLTCDQSDPARRDRQRTRDDDRIGLLHPAHVLPDLGARVMDEVEIQRLLVPLQRIDPAHPAVLQEGERTDSRRALEQSDREDREVAVHIVDAMCALDESLQSVQPLESPLESNRDRVRVRGEPKLDVLALALDKARPGPEIDAVSNGKQDDQRHERGADGGESARTIRESRRNVGLGDRDTMGKRIPQA